VLRWHLQREKEKENNKIVVIPKSQTPERIKENINIFDFVLSEDDVSAITEIGTTNKIRLADPVTIFKFPLFD
jgi:2,5-diketo-D-gluconate reductase A